LIDLHASVIHHIFDIKAIWFIIYFSSYYFANRAKNAAGDGSTALTAGSGYYNGEAVWVGRLEISEVRREV
jgi:hypothetical protein